MQGRALTSAYFGLQAVAGGAWWVWLWIDADARRLFSLPDDPGESVLLFALSDLVLFVGGSAVAGIAVLSRRRWAPAAAWLVVGATVYAALWCVSATLMRSASPVGAIAMLLASGASTVAAVTATAKEPLLDRFYREVGPMSAVEARRRTLAQMVVFWITFLAVVPYGLLRAADHFALARWPAEPFRPWALVLFAVASALGVWSALTMSREGRGTPLPNACAPSLVTGGPYARVRNPMAVAGIAQGVAVGLLLGAPLVVAYALAGAVVWHFCVRPSEERDLSRRFGESYDGYRSRTPLWIPVRRG